MSKLVFIFLIMVWLHIADDFYLQGKLAQMKQKSWWEKQPGYNNRYKYDYIVALLAHGFSWSFVVHIPIMVIYYLNEFPDYWGLGFSILINCVLHSFVDHCKANKKNINLIIDQMIHIIQLVNIMIVFGEFI